MSPGFATPELSARPFRGRSHSRDSTRRGSGGGVDISMKGKKPLTTKELIPLYWANYWNLHSEVLKVRVEVD